MKTLFITSVLGLVALLPVTASAGTIVIHTGGSPYRYHGRHYRYHHRHHYYNHRVWVPARPGYPAYYRYW